MITKKDIICLKPLREGPFFRDFIVTLNIMETEPRLFQLRVMSKRQIVKCKEDEKMVIDELYIRSNLRHPFIVNQICAFQDYDNLFYLTEYAPLKIFDRDIFPRKFSIEAIRFYAAEITLGLLYFHSRNQIYTFLSPENLLIGADGHIKLDFSFCNGLNVNQNDMYTYVEYASPIYLLKHDFTFASDFWSFGIVLFAMAAGYTPFGEMTADATVYAMMSSDIEFPESMDKDLADLISILLTPSLFTDDYQENSQLIRNHAFFTGVDWAEFERKAIEPPYKPNVICSDLKNMPSLDSLYTSDYIVGEKDGYGDIFSSYSTTSFMKI